MDSNPNSDPMDGESTVSNVRALKNYFQSKNLPIMGLTPIGSNSFGNSSNEPSLSETKVNSHSTSDKPSDEWSSNTRPIRPNRIIPRPPKPMECSEVSPLMKVLPTVQSERPVPKPRKSLQSNRNKVNSENNNNTSSHINANSDNNVNNQSFISGDNHRSNSLTLSTIEELKQLNLNGRNLKSHSIHSLPQNSLPIAANDQNSCQTYNPNYNKVCMQTIDQTVVDSSCRSIDEKMMATDKQSSTKSKKPFKSFLKRSKLLSLRRKSVENSKKHKPKLGATNNNSIDVTQPRPVRPTRTPPLPPLLRFRPAAPLPPESGEEYYGDTLNASNTNNSNNPYELYNDAGHSEQIYCSLDNDDESGSDFYEGINDYDDGLTGDKHSYVTENYYEDSFDNMNSDCDRIYEVLPFERDLETDSDSSASTVSLDQKQIQIDCDPSAKKRELKAVKLKKKFNLTGEEIPVNAGIVKEDNKGSRYDLYVRKGETVLILRMEGNPPGKWLAKNERAKVGFVDLANISFDAESVKCIIKTLAPHKP